MNLYWKTLLLFWFIFINSFSLYADENLNTSSSLTNAYILLGGEDIVTQDGNTLDVHSSYCINSTSSESIGSPYSWIGTATVPTSSYLGMRFHGSKIPQNSQITNATLVITNNAYDKQANLNVKLYAESSLEPVAYPCKWKDRVISPELLPSGRTSTLAKTDYHYNLIWRVGDQHVIDVTEQVKELQQQNLLGETINFISKGEGGGRHSFFNHRNTSVDLDTLPFLTITYQPPAIPTNQAALENYFSQLSGFEHIDYLSNGYFTVTINGVTYKKQLVNNVQNGTPTYEFQMTQIEDQNNDGIADFRITYPSGDQQTLYDFGVYFVEPTLPPDPSLIASPIDPTVPSLFHDNTAFIYTGENAIQTGMSANAIVPLQSSVIRGKISTRDGQPLSGVKVTIHQHPEFGQTLSRADGWFDMAVNGGGLITLNYQKIGYLPVQRQVEAPWLDYAFADDAVMIPVDTQVTKVDLTQNIQQIAEGSPVTDADGTRQARIVFPAGTTASLVMPDGSQQSLTELDIRATEYTIGSMGQATMPGQLPPTTAYTYAVDLTVDQALNIGATGVTFNQPVYVYVNNFVGFPTGTLVPSAYYDFQKAAWIGDKHGYVIKLLSITNGLANLSIDNTEQLATNDKLASLNITDTERQYLAQTYPVGSSLWRVPVTHFTPYDFNWAKLPPLLAAAPKIVLAIKNGITGDDNIGGDATNISQSIIAEAQQSPMPDPICFPGSSITCERQTLGETLPVSGTPFSLNYLSELTTGYVADRTIPITISPPPSNVIATKMEIQIAGQDVSVYLNDIQQSAEGITYSYVWNGKDIYGRTLQGLQRFRVRVGFQYKGMFVKSYLGGFASVGGGGFSSLSGARDDAFVTLWSPWSEGTLGNLQDARGQGLGGWTLDIHHQYLPTANTLIKGNGEKINDQTVGSLIVSSLKNVEICCSEMAIDKAGSIYFLPANFSNNPNHVIKKRLVDGTIVNVAGTGFINTSTTLQVSDSVDAISRNLANITKLTMGADGNLYFIEKSFDGTVSLLHRLTPDGKLYTLMGRGTQVLRDADITDVQQIAPPSILAMAVAQDGTVYFSTSANLSGLYRLNPSGQIYKVQYLGAASQWTFPYLAFSNNGNLYTIRDFNPINGTNTKRTLIRYSPDGKISELLNTNTDDKEGLLYNLATDTQGNVYFMHYAYRYPTEGGGVRLFQYQDDGQTKPSLGGNSATVIIAGNTSVNFTVLDDNVPSGIVKFEKNNLSNVFAIAPDNSIYFTGYENKRIRKFTSALPNVSLDNYVVADKSGSIIYIFDRQGRHLKTVETLTGQTIYSFAYNSDGYLVSVTDKDGEITQITRDTNNLPIMIVAPHGQQTILTLNENRYLSQITNPNNEFYQLHYTNGGLLTKLINPRGKETTFEYDRLGRLKKENNPAGGIWELARITSENGFTTTISTKLGKVYKQIFIQSSSYAKRTFIQPDGTQTIFERNSDGSSRTTSADGTIVTTNLTPDPRFGMMSPLRRQTITLPNGLTNEIKQEIVSYSPSATGDYTRPSSLIEKTSYNGRAYTSSYTAVDKKIVYSSPVGRQSVSYLDEKGQTIRESVAGLEEVRYNYDNLGRVTQLSTGSGEQVRNVVVSYDAQGNIQAVTDALNRQVSFTYDAVGRVLSQTLTDGRIVYYQYDTNGNVTSITPPSRPQHTFEYNAVDSQTEYTPPVLPAIAAPQTQYIWNEDKELTQIVRPDGQTITLNYAQGRLSSLTLPNGTQTLSYDTAGRVTSLTATDGGTLSYTYAGSLTLSEISTGAVAGSVALTYNNDLRVTQATVNGSSIAYQYDNDGLLMQVGAVQLTRNMQNGLLTKTTLGNVTTQRSYSSFGEVSEETASYQTMPLYHVLYIRDKAGRITQKLETVNGVTHTLDYRYDAAGRLAEVKQDGVITESYQYDANGNRLNNNAQYDAQDRLLQYGTNTYSYTFNGELLTKNNTTYHYDVVGNLRQVQLPTKTIEYVIDAKNRRVGKKVNGVLTQGFIYQGKLKPVAQLDGQGNLVARFVYASKANIPDYILKNGNTYRVISDHLGSPRLIVDVQTGTIVQRLEYDAFGNITEDTNPEFQPFGFAGGLYDVDTKLTRFGARDYEAETGRWTAKDPIGFGGGDSNLFGYVASDPINSIDPLGLAEYCGVCANSDCAVYGGARCDTAFTVIGGVTGNSSATRSPDFYNIQIDAHVFSIWGTYSRSGNSFAGVGVNKTLPSTVRLAVSFSGGWLNATDVTPEQVDNFLDGYGGNAFGGYDIVGGSIMFSPGNGTATSVGLGFGMQMCPESSSSANTAFGVGYSKNQGPTGFKGW